MSTESQTQRITPDDDKTFSDIPCGYYTIRMKACDGTYPCIHTVTNSVRKSFQEMLNEYDRNTVHTSIE